MPAALGGAGHIRPAITAGICNPAFGPLDRLGTGLSGVSLSGRVLPSRAGRGPPDSLRRFRSRPIPSFDGGICEFTDVLRGLPTSASSSVIQATSRSIISCCCASSASLSASLRPKRGGNGICRVNQIPTPAATFSASPREQLPLRSVDGGFDDVRDVLAGRCRRSTSSTRSALRGSGARDRDGP